MNRILPSIAGAVLGLLFILFSSMFLFHFGPAQPPPPEGSPPALFMSALVPTGYFTFIKSFELLGGILVAIPKTRNFGLLILGPIIINILAFHTFLAHGAGITKPPVVLISLLAIYLLWDARKSFAGLIGK